MGLVCFPLDASAKFKAALQGLSKNEPIWISGNLMGWGELDYIPVRVYFTGGPSTSETIEVGFDQMRNTIPGVENLTGWTPSSNVVITEQPVLNAPPGNMMWTYTFKVNLTDGNPGYVEFRARLSAGAHLNVGSSLQLNGKPALGSLQIHKPGPGAGIPDLMLIKSGPATAVPNQVITYTITYSNKSTSKNQSVGVQVSDILPVDVEFVPGSATGGGVLVGNILFWDLGDLPIGATGTITYQARVKSDVPFGSSFRNFAQILSSENDETPNDNNDSVITTVVFNRAPVAMDDAYDTDEDMVLTITAPGVLVNDTDADGDPLRVIPVGAPAHGSVTLNANGSFAYTPNGDYTGPDSFTYKVTDEQLESNVATVRITVNPLNDAPVAMDDVYETDEDMVLTITAPGVLSNDTDTDGDPLRVIPVGSPAHGSVTLNANGSFAYTPNGDYNGLDNFSYRVFDGMGESELVTVSITVNPVNDPPSFDKGPDIFLQRNSGLQSFENWASNLSAGPADEAGQALSFEISLDNLELFVGSSQISNLGTLRFQPREDIYGRVTVTVVLKDDGGTANGGQDTSISKTFTITINAPPTVSITKPADGSVFLAGSDILVNATAGDVDGGITRLEILSGADILVTGGVVPQAVVLTNVAAGSYEYVARAEDDRNASATSSPVRITVVEGLAVLAGPIQLNPQSGLFNQSIQVSNITSRTLTAIQVMIYGLSETEKVYNLSGSKDGIPFVIYNAPAEPGEVISLMIEYYSPNRIAPTPYFIAMETVAMAPVLVEGVLVPVTRRLRLSDGSFLVEFNSVQGESYFIEYSGDLEQWNVVIPRVVGTGTSLQWIDNGPPKTESHPRDESGRFYRVRLAQ